MRAKQGLRATVEIKVDGVRVMKLVDEKANKALREMERIIREKGMI